MPSGKVNFYDWKKGFGYIENPAGRDIYVHKRAIQGDGFNILVAGETVDYEAEPQADRDGQLKAIWVKTRQGRPRGIVKEFDHKKGFGLIEPFEPQPDLWFHYRSLLGVEDGHRAVIEKAESVEFDIKVDERGRTSAINIKRLDPRLPLFRFANVGTIDAFEDQLKALAGLAQRENWNYRKPVQEQDEFRSSFPILRSYLMYTFARLKEENKIALAERDGRRYACFNTGLVTPNQEEIFAYFDSNPAVSRDGCDWKLAGFRVSSDRDLLQTFANLPELANYFDDPSMLLYDRRRQLHVDIDHIIEDNASRLPESLRNNPYLAHQVLEGAREVSRKRVYRNYKTAIPQFYRGEIQLLLPLCLEKRHEADVALVVSLMGENHYRGDTILTLDQAYNNARLITKPDDEWLNP